MQLPTQQQCVGYFEEYHVPKNIKAHCYKVQQVSIFLGKKLQETGEVIDLELVGSLAALHDLFKVVSLKELVPNHFHPEEFTEQEITSWKNLREQYPGKYETEVAFEIFKTDFPEFAEHLRRAGNPKLNKTCWEEIIVHYADWRVDQETIIPLKDRLKSLQQRYQSDEDVWQRSCQMVKDYEKMIFKKLNYLPIDLKYKLGNE